MINKLVCLSLLAFAGTAHADCFDEAGKRHAVPADLLRAIACVESGNDPHAINYNRNGTTDYGLMQINAIWLPRLADYGIEQKHLWDMCTNVHVGAWVMAQKIAAFGFTWRAIGAYNAGLEETPLREHLRYEYATKVYSAIDNGC